MIKRVSVTLSPAIQAELASPHCSEATKMAAGDIASIQKFVLLGGELDSPCKEWEGYFRKERRTSLEHSIKFYVQRSQRLAISLLHDRFEKAGTPRINLQFFGPGKNIGFLCDVVLIYLNATRAKALSAYAVTRDGVPQETPQDIHC